MFTPPIASLFILRERTCQVFSIFNTYFTLTSLTFLICFPQVNKEWDMSGAKQNAISYQGL